MKGTDLEDSENTRRMWPMQSFRGGDLLNGEGGTITA